MISPELYSKINVSYHRFHNIEDELSRLSDLKITGPVTEDDLSSIVEIAPNIKKITISATNNITNLPENLGQLAFLDEIVITDFNNPDQILAILNSIAYVARHIKRLSFISCNLNNLLLPINFPHFINLEKLEFVRCIVGDSLFKLAISGLSIEQLYIENIEFTADLPDNFSHFISLKKLNIAGTISGETFVKLAACVSNVEEIDMEFIQFTSDIPANLPMLSALKFLYLNESNINCRSLFAILSKSPNIELLHFYSCEEIRNLPQEIELPLLPKLKAIHSSLSNISQHAFKQLIDKSINLIYLDAELTKTISADVKGLKVLDASKDDVVSGDLVKVFNNNPNLERITLSFRSISLDGLPAKFNNLNNLLEIDLSDGVIPDKGLAKLIPCFATKTYFIAGRTPHNSNLLPENALTIYDQVILASKFDKHLQQFVSDGLGKDTRGLSIICLKAKSLRDIIISRLCCDEESAKKPFFNFLLMYFDPRMQAMFSGVIFTLNKNNILKQVFNQKAWHLSKEQLFHIFINCCLFKGLYDVDKETREAAYSRASTIDFGSFASVYDSKAICFIELFDNIISFMSAPEVEITSKRKRLRYY